MAIKDIFEDAASSAVQSVFDNDNPVAKVIDAVDAIGVRQKIAKGFGGTLGSFTSAVSEARKKYNFRATINSSGVSVGNIEANIKSITRPALRFKYRENRYLNSTKRIIQHVTFDPIKIEIYDNMANTVQNDIYNLIKKKYIKNSDKKLVVGGSIEIGSHDDTLIDSIVIHSGASPVSSLIGRGIESITREPSNLLSKLFGEDPTSMIMSSCYITDIEFGDFDYESDGSDPSTITLTIEYQSLSFGSSSIASDIGALAVSRAISAI